MIVEVLFPKSRHAVNKADGTTTNISKTVGTGVLDCPQEKIFGGERPAANFAGSGAPDGDFRRQPWMPLHFRFPKAVFPSQGRRKDF